MLNVVTIGTSFITDLFLQAVEQLEGIRCTGMYTRTRDCAGTAPWRLCHLHRSG